MRQVNIEHFVSVYNLNIGIPFYFAKKVFMEP